MKFNIEGILQRAKAVVGVETVSPLVELQLSVGKDVEEIKKLVQSLPPDFQEKLYQDIKFSDEPDSIFAAQGLAGKPIPREVEAQMVFTLRSMIRKLEDYSTGFTRPQGARVFRLWKDCLIGLRSAAYRDLPNKLDEFVKNLKSLS